MEFSFFDETEPVKLDTWTTSPSPSNPRFEEGKATESSPAPRGLSLASTITRAASDETAPQRSRMR